MARLENAVLEGKSVESELRERFQCHDLCQHEKSMLRSELDLMTTQLDDMRLSFNQSMFFLRFWALNLFLFSLHDSL